MGALWDQFVNLVQSADRSAEPPAPAPAFVAAAPQRYAPEASLEAIGMRNEALRAQIEEVGHGFEHLDQVKGLFHALVTPMSELLTEFETTRARLQETKTKLAFLEDAHQGLNARHGAAVDERDVFAEAKNALQRENRDLAQRAQRVEAALAEAQREARETLSEREKLDRLLDAGTRRGAAMGDEIRRLKEELSNKDQSLASLEHAFKVASDQAALLQQETATQGEAARALAARLEIAGKRVADLESRVEDLEAQTEQDKHRLAATEQALAEEQTAHANQRAKHLDHVERSRAEASALSNTVHAVRGRIEVTNKILDQTRGQLREKIEELRAAERQLFDNGIRIDLLEKSARAQREDLAGANERIAGTERMRGALVDQVNGLSETVRAKEAALQAAARTIEQLTSRVEEATGARQRLKEELERRTAMLQDEIARTRAERQLADGALEASRAERQQARRASPADLPHESLGTSAAVEFAEAGAVEPSNVMKLARSAAL